DVIITGSHQAAGNFAGDAVSANPEEPDRTRAHPAFALKKTIDDSVRGLKTDQRPGGVRPSLENRTAVARQDPARRPPDIIAVQLRAGLPKKLLDTRIERGD